MVLSLSHFSEKSLHFFYIPSVRFFFETCPINMHAICNVFLRIKQVILHHRSRHLSECSFFSLSKQFFATEVELIPFVPGQLDTLQVEQVRNPRFIVSVLWQITDCYQLHSLFGQSIEKSPR